LLLLSNLDWVKQDQEQEQEADLDPRLFSDENSRFSQFQSLMNRTRSPLFRHWVIDLSFVIRISSFLATAQSRAPVAQIRHTTFA
jgi:hypothetical protein